MLRVTYTKLRPEFPDLEHRAPAISPQHRRLARLTRPPALPHQCPPWRDAAEYGILLRYPYGGFVHVHGGAPARVEYATGVVKQAGGPFVDAFAANYFSIRVGYRFRTPHGIGLLVAAAIDDGAPAPAVPGLIETWWYPRPLFIVFHNPAPSEAVTFRPGDALCLLLPVPCDGLDIRTMTTTEEEEVSRDDEEYLAEAARRPNLNWISIEGVGFSHRYRLFSRSRHRRSN